MAVISIRERARYCLGSAFDAWQPRRTVPAALRAEMAEAASYVNYRADLAQWLAAYNALCRPPRPVRLADLAGRYLFGDVNRALPVHLLTKSRPVGARRNVLLDLDRGRHWGGLAEVDRADVPWAAKRDAAVWRGSTTGVWDEAVDRGRRALAARYAAHPSPDIDVGVTALIQSAAEGGDGAARRRWARLLKPPMSVAAQLRYRYIVSVEGNDVASNLRWALYSRSTVLMARPRMESWLQEGRLEAGVHYVRLRDDYADLPERLRWCREHPREARRIAEAGRRYVLQFLDRRREAAVAAEVLRRFLKNVP